LSEGLSAVAARLEPGEAAALCGQAGRTLTQAKKNTTDPKELLALSEGLSAVAARLEPGEAARTLTQAMSNTTDPYALDALAEGLSAVLTRVDLPGQHRSTAALMACFGLAPDGSIPFAGLALLQLALQPLSYRLSTPELVELLKQPLCVGQARRIVLDQLATRYGRPFADQWEFVRFAQEKRLDLDFTTPPQRDEAHAAAAH
jgi:hypothetical protein